jgi:phosphoribosylformylglycinamidine synthase
VPYGKPERIVTALDIMIEGPLGGAAFNNEFGRPALNGYFRTFEQAVSSPRGAEVRGYHKPIMLAGGYGNINAAHTAKKPLGPGTVFIQLGGPAFLIGLGGGAASSMASGQNVESLDFDSVQRANAELERRCQEVIDACWQMGDDNPILSIHDVGAGGLSNAFPELAHSGGVGATFDLRAIPNEEPGMTPMQIWSNESQERYVLAIDGSRLADFERMCERERCLYAVVGEARADHQLAVDDPLFGNRPVDMALDVLLGRVVVAAEGEDGVGGGSLKRGVDDVTDARGGRRIDEGAVLVEPRLALTARDHEESAHTGEGLLSSLGIRIVHGVGDRVW